jgi:uncharacterized protein
MKIIVAGGTGFVGKALVKRLIEEKHQVVVLSRRADAFKNMPLANLKVELWDSKTAGIWVSQLDGADAVVNLAGENIAGKRWTPKQKEILRSSRLNATQALVDALARAKRRPEVLINASAVGYYGSVETGAVREDAPKGSGFLADLCAEWEAAARKASSTTRVVILRFGVVLEKDGGALPKFLTPFRFFAGGPLGSGRQAFPWVHRADVIGAILYSLQNPSVLGVYNMTAPGALTMKEFCSVLGKVMNRPSWAAVPEPALKLLLGEMAEMLITGQKAVPDRLEQAGYHFRYPQAEQALTNILQK